MKKIRIFMVIYILLVAVYGALTADPEFVNFFQGTRMLAWYAILFAFHGLVIVISNKVMEFICSIFIKIANKEAYDKQVAKEEILTNMLIIYYVRIALVYLGYFLNLSSWIAYISIVSAFIICFKIFKNEKYEGWKKIIVMFPFVVYIILDISSLLAI